MSVALKARDRQSRLHMSMRKPLKVMMLGRAAGGIASSATFCRARTEQRPDSVGSDGARKVSR